MRRLPDARRMPGAPPSAAVRRVAGTVGVAALATVLAACSTSSSAPPRAAASAPVTTTTTPQPTVEQADQIPDCDTLLPVTVVHDALNQTTLGPAYTRDVAHPSIHRTGSVSCAYTLTGYPIAASGPSVSPLPVISPAAPPSTTPGAPAAAPASPTPTGPPKAVTGTLATYTDAAAAADRVQQTVDTARQHGDTVVQATIGGQPAWLLADTQSTTLVLADRNRTITVDVYPLAAPTQNAAAVATRLAMTMLTAPFGAADASQTAGPGQ